jgi:hypothetical protein
MRKEKMPKDVTGVFLYIFSKSRGPVPSQPDVHQPVEYGVKATLDGKILDVELTFLKGSVYCCYQHDCNLPIYTGRRWNQLREEFSKRGYIVEDQLELRLTCVIEKDSLFFDFSRPDPNHRGFYEFKTVDAYRYCVTMYEALLDEDNSFGQRPSSP